MIFKCPGSQKFSQAYPEFIKCPFCNKEVEIWSDEIKIKCPFCKKPIMREAAQSCLDWCKYAKECVGEKVYKKYMKQKETKNVKQKRTRRGQG